MVSALRYMNISDEWETPEKQDFKDFVCCIPLETMSRLFVSNVMSQMLRPIVY